MVSKAMTVPMIGIASGVSTTLFNLALSKKMEGRAEITEKEVVMSMAAAFGGSALAYLFIRRKEEVDLGLPEGASA